MNLIDENQIIKSAIRLISTNRLFFGIYFLFLIIGLIILLQIDKGDAVIFFNEWRGTLWDDIFKFFSSIGEGLFLGLILLVVGVISIKYAFNTLLLYLSSGLVSQIIKNIYKIPRPKVFFEGTDLVTYVKDFEIWASNSFPSGHSTSGFTIFLYLAIISQNKFLGLLFAIMAIMVGMSRVYLVQHFFIDIYVGSIIGIFVTLFVYSFLQNWQKLNNSKWYNFSLYKNFKK